MSKEEAGIGRIAMWVALTLFALLFARQLPELRRYLKIRNM